MFFTTEVLFFANLNASSFSLAAIFCFFAGGSTAGPAESPAWHWEGGTALLDLEETCLSGGGPPSVFPPVLLQARSGNLNADFISL